MITQKELRKVCKDYSEATQKQYLNCFTKHEIGMMVDICKKAVGNFRPDLIYTFMSEVPFLKKIFPNVPVLHQEVGIFSRFPFPVSYFIDPFGTFSNGFLSKYGKELNSLKSFVLPCENI